MRRSHIIEQLLGVAISAPVEMPVTTSNCGRVPVWLQPTSTPAPKAPSDPPPDSNSTSCRLPT
jgi:hypothetical protein